MKVMNIKKQIEQVKEFRKAFNLPIATELKIISKESKDLHIMMKVMNIEKQIEQVKEFRKAFNLSIATELRIISKESKDLHIKLLNEELEELKEAVKENNKIEIADAVIDLLYVSLGCALDYGISFKKYDIYDYLNFRLFFLDRIIKEMQCDIEILELHNEIDPDYTGICLETHYLLKNIILRCFKISVYFDFFFQLEALFTEVHKSNMSKLENGKPIYRKDGKVLKGKDYFKPNLKKILEA